MGAPDSNTAARSPSSKNLLPPGRYRSHHSQMSVKVMSMVFEHYPEGGSEMLLALALADFSNDDGTQIYPSVSALGKKTRQSDRNVQLTIKKMLANGFLTLVEAGGREGKKYRANEYRINLFFFDSSDTNLGGEIFSPMPKKPENNGVSARGEIFSPLNVLGVKKTVLGVKNGALGGEIAISPHTPYTTIITTTTTTSSSSKESKPVVVVNDLIFPPQTPQAERDSIQAVLVSTGVGEEFWQQLVDELIGARMHRAISNPAGYIRGMAERVMSGTFTPERGVGVANAREEAAAQAKQDEAQKKAFLESRPPTGEVLNRLPARQSAFLEKMTEGQVK